MTTKPSRGRAARARFPHAGRLLIAAGAALGIAAPALAQYQTGFEAPEFAGSPGGVVLTGQGGWALPSGVDMSVFTSEGNALGLPANPAGGGQFIGGTGNDGVDFLRAEHPVDISILWVNEDHSNISYDVAVTYSGDLPAQPNLTSFSLQPSATSRSYVQVSNFMDVNDPSAGWKIEYNVYDSAGNPLLNQSPGVAWTGLALNHWYRVSTTVMGGTNTINHAVITDLDTGVTSETDLAWYLQGGADLNAFPIPTAERFFVGGSAGGTAGYDNLLTTPSGGFNGACYTAYQQCLIFAQNIPGKVWLCGVDYDHCMHPTDPAPPWGVYLDPTFSIISTGYTLDAQNGNYLDWNGVNAVDVAIDVSSDLSLPIDHIDVRLYNDTFNTLDPFGTLVGSVDAGGDTHGIFDVDADIAQYQGMDGALVAEVHYAPGAPGLWDQSAFKKKLFAPADQDFPDAPPFSIYEVDDFSTYECTWNVDGVHTYFTKGNGAWNESIQQGQLQLFPKVGALPRESDKAPQYTVPISLTDHGTFWEVFADTTGVAALQGISGDYWIGLTPVADDGTYGQEYHLQFEEVGGDQAALRNPGGAFGFGDNWVGVDTVSNKPKTDMAFKLDFHLVGQVPVRDVAGIYMTAKAPPCYGDFTGDGQLDIFDFLGFVNKFNAQDPSADCDHNGIFDLFDFLCFVNAFNTGC